MRARALFLVVLVVCGLAGAAQAKVVACVGDSITYGSGIADRARDSYPAQLQRILQQYDPAWEVLNFGVSGATLLHRGDKPYIRETASTGALVTHLMDVSRGAAPLVSETVVTDGAWHLVRFVWDGSFRSLYVDGRLVATDTKKLSSLKFSSAGFHIGAGKDLEPGSLWSGLLDDIRIYNRAIKP